MGGCTAGALRQSWEKRSVDAWMTGVEMKNEGWPIPPSNDPGWVGIERGGRERGELRWKATSRTSRGL